LQVAELHPSSAQPFDASDMDAAAFRLALNRELAALIPRNNLHNTRHSATCFKYARRRVSGKKQRLCRFRFPRRLVPKSVIENKQVRLQRHHHWVNAFNPVISAACRCNTDIRFLMSGPDAKGAMYYICDYITKRSLTTHNAYTLAHLALRKQEAAESLRGAVNPDKRSAALITRCLNQMVSVQERSSAEVINVLMGYDDHFAVDCFVPLYLPNFVKPIDFHFHNVRRMAASKLAASKLDPTLEPSVDGVDTVDDTMSLVAHDLLLLP
jgi:hypothetical protein